LVQSVLDNEAHHVRWLDLHDHENQPHAGHVLNTSRQFAGDAVKWRRLAHSWERALR
jgi:hypothetical protein